MSDFEEKKAQRKRTGRTIIWEKVEKMLEDLEAGVHVIEDDLAEYDGESGDSKGIDMNEEESPLLD